VLKHYPPPVRGYSSGDSRLYLPANKFNVASEGKSHVVSPSFPLGTRSPTSSYGTLATPGTLLCVAERYRDHETPLSVAEIKTLAAGELRKLHPTEQLAAFSFAPHEFPQFRGDLSAQYTAVAQTICLNVFEAFAAEALAAMGKPCARDALYTRLDAMHLTAHRQPYHVGGSGQSSEDGSENAALPGWLEARVSKLGVPFCKYVPLREADDTGDDPADDLCEYEKQNLANIESNRKKLEELGLL